MRGEVFWGNIVCFLKQSSIAVLQITQNELFAGGHKLNVPQCVNAQREAPHLAGVLLSRNLTLP